ncbi:hypothetical protein GOODEAATRI_033824, partial [Goodea atripinnis]
LAEEADRGLLATSTVCMHFCMHTILALVAQEGSEAAEAVAAVSERRKDNTPCFYHL